MADDVRKTFHTDLGALQDQVVQLAALATESVQRATQALLAGDLVAAQAVIDRDDVLDAMAIEIEEACYRLLALQQPMASDLRRIVTDLWVTAEVERIGDLSSNICKGTRRLFGSSFDPRIRGLIAEMSEEAVRLTRLSIDAFVDDDAGLAAALDDIDDRLDSLHATFIQTIFEVRGGGGLDLQPAVQLALIGRYYERIGDHGVNVGERVRFMVDGWLPEHTGAAREHERERIRDQNDPTPNGRTPDD
jgi:phosphate transport system protein